MQEKTRSSSLNKWLNGLLTSWHAPEDLVLIGTALVVGISTGLGAIIFRYLIRGVEWIGYTWIPMVTSQWGKAYVVFVPAFGGLLVGLLIYNFAREAKGHGVPEVMEAVALRGGRIRPVVAVVKSLASSLTIGSGGSAGREGPIVQIGSAIGSSLGQWLKMSDERVSNLVACGAAAGIAATFNAPIAGVVFALEIILGGRFTVRYFSSVVISSVAASVMGRVAFGNVPAFNIPTEYGLNNLWEYLLYPVLGVLAALVGVAFTRSLYAGEDFFDDRKRIPEWVKPAIGGALLGLLALAYPLVKLTQPITWDRMPQIFNVGYDVIEAALTNELALGVVVALLFLKILATVLTLGSGASGGVFAPSLFMGAMLGAGFALTIERLMPGVIGAPGAYALVGMAAVFAASAHAPITAILILFELTGDYRIILPLMLTVVVSTLLAQRLLHNESIYTLKLTRRGVRLNRGRDRDILQNVMVREIVLRTNIHTVPLNMTLSKLGDFLRHSHHHGVSVLDADGKLWGVVALSDLEQALDEGMSPDKTIEAIGTTWPHLKVAFMDEPIGDALARMGIRSLGRMPVVAREDPYDLLGMIRREDIIRAYDLALSRRDKPRDRTGRQQQSEQIDETEFVEVYLKASDPAVGKKLQEIAPLLPENCVLISIERQGHVTIPHGDTIFQVGDHITAYTRHEDAGQLFHSLHGE